MVSGRLKHATRLFAKWLAGLFFIVSIDAALADKITPVELCVRQAYAEKLAAIILNEGIDAIANAKIDQAELLSACNASAALLPNAQIPDGVTARPSEAAPPSSFPSVSEAAQPKAASGASAGSAGPEETPKTGWVDKPGQGALNSSAPIAVQEDGAGTALPPTATPILDGNQPNDAIAQPNQPAAESEEGLPVRSLPTPASEEGLPLPANRAAHPQAAGMPAAQNDSGAAPGEAGSDNPSGAARDAGTGGGLLGGVETVSKPPEAGANTITPPGAVPSDAKAGGTDTAKATKQPTDANSSDPIEAEQQAALRTVQAWRANGSPAWFKSGLPMVKQWLGAADWNPDAGDFFAAEIVRFGLNLMWLDNEYRDRVKNVDSAAESCRKIQWDLIDAGLSAGTLEAAEWAWEMERFRNEILGNLQRSCNRLQHELSLGCGELVPFDTKGAAIFKATNALRQDTLNCCAVRGSGSEEQKAFFRADYLAALKTRNAKIDPEIAALEPILQARAKAIDAALAKIGSVETKRTLLGLGPGMPNPAARTLRSKLQNVSVYEKVMRVAAGRPDGVPQSRWNELKDVLQKKTDCAVCWFSSECDSSGSSGATSSYDTMPRVLRDLIEAVNGELLILAEARVAEESAETQATYDERNKAIRDKMAQAYEATKARNAEAQAKRGTAEDPDGKLADKAAAEEAKAKHDLDLEDCISKVAQTVRNRPNEESIAKWNTVKADCEAEISGKAVASNAPPGAPAKPGTKPPLPPLPPQPEGAKPSAGGAPPPPEAGPPEGVKPPQPAAQAAAGGPPSPGPKAGGAGPVGPPKQLSGLPLAPQSGNAAGAQKPQDAPLSPEQFGKAVQEAMEKLGVKPRVIAAGEPLYNEFSPWLAQKAGLDVQTAIVAAAFKEKVPIDRLLDVMKFSRDDVAKSLDGYLQSLQGITSADERHLIVQKYLDLSQAAHARD
jgi:hypothetical protein